MDKRKFYRAKEWGHCGSCSFINLIGLKGSLRLERELISIGRARPFFNSDWTSFLIWAKKYNIKLEVYLTTKKFHEEKYDKLERRKLETYKNFSIKKFNQYKVKAKKRYEALLKRFEKQVNITKDPIKKIDILLQEDYNVVVLISDYYAKPRGIFPHLIVAYKKQGEKYYFMDSAYGLITLTKKQIKQGIEINKKYKIYTFLVAYKK